MNKIVEFHHFKVVVKSYPAYPTNSRDLYTLFHFRHTFYNGC